tara:strand:- start:117 stop:311 length:195 start_codon:yes stop_codon:yes gene_type:complete
MNNGVWLPGDIVAPDGWSSTQHSTLAECEYHKDIFNNYLESINVQKRAVGKCVTYDPSLPIEDS